MSRTVWFFVLAALTLGVMAFLLPWPRHGGVDRVSNTSPSVQSLPGPRGVAYEVVSSKNELSSGGDEELKRCRDALRDLQETIDGLRRGLDACKTESLEELVLDPEVKGLLQWSAADQMERRDLKYRDLVKRVSEGYDRLRPEVSMTCLAEQPLFTNAVNRDTTIGAYVEWLAGITGELSQDEIRGIEEIYGEYIDRYIDVHRSSEPGADVRYKDLLLQWRFDRRNERIRATLDSRKAARFDAFMELRTRYDQAWLRSFAGPLEQDAKTSNNVEFAGWLVKKGIIAERASK